jgi:hypothetical protein
MVSRIMIVLHWEHTRDLLRRSSGEVINLALIWCSRAMPEKHPLQSLAALEILKRLLAQVLKGLSYQE